MGKWDYQGILILGLSISRGLLSLSPLPSHPKEAEDIIDQCLCVLIDWVMIQSIIRKLNLDNMGVLLVSSNSVLRNGISPVSTGHEAGLGDGKQTEGKGL